MSLTRKELRSDIHWFGFTDLETKQVSFNYPNNKILTVLDYDFSYPLIIYLWIGEITPLLTLKHTDVEYLNNIGITIYLYEPLSAYVDIDGIDRAKELDSILTYVRNNNLTNVTVHTCDYHCEDIYGYYTDAMKLVTDDIYLRTVVPNLLNSDPTKFTKKFISLNSRYTESRHLTAAYLHSKNNSHVSWNYYTDDYIFDTVTWLDLVELDDAIKSTLPNILEQLNNNSPLIVDTPVSNAIQVTATNKQELAQQFGFNTNNPEPYYADSFCSVITETKYDHPSSNISEKTFCSIAYKKPFVLVAPPHSIEYLHSMGYKTFGDFWDESYDYETDHTKRLIKIFKTIDYIDSLTITELRELYDIMQPIIEHNFNLLHSTQPIHDLFTGIHSNYKLKQTLWINSLHHSKPSPIVKSQIK